jgi:hypothetical protein
MSWMELIRNGTSGRSVHPRFVRWRGSFVALRMTAQCCETNPSICPICKNAAANPAEFPFGLDLASPEEVHLLLRAIPRARAG